VGGHLNPGRKGRVLRLKPGYGSAALPHMSGDKLGIDAGRIDDGKSGNERSETPWGPPPPGGRVSADNRPR
jgi:hypothetical protein